MKTFGWGALAALCVACEPVPPQSLDDIALPPDFRLDTSHDVQFTMRGDADGTVDVRTPAGDPLIRGRATSLAQAPVLLHVPYGTDHLTATLRSPDGSERTWVVAVEGTEAVWDLGVAP